MDDKAFVEFFNNLIEASCGKRGCRVENLPTDILKEEEESTAHEGYPDGIV